MDSTSETIRDFKLSWNLFKANYKAFLATELFAVVAFIISNIIIVTFLLLIFYVLPNLDIADLLPKNQNMSDSYFFILGLFTVLIYILFSGFLYCQYGLAYDIFSSGDMFTEFKNSFSYFKKYWWQYILLTFINGFDVFILDRRFVQSPENENFVLSPYIRISIRFVFSFVLIVIFTSTLPSVTAQGNLIRSFKESFRILKRDFKRLLLTWGLFYLLFIAPLFIASLILVSLVPLVKGTYWLILIFTVILLLYIYKFFVGFPMMALIATRIYNTVDFERFKPLPPEHDNATVTVDKTPQSDLVSASKL